MVRGSESSPRSSSSSPTAPNSESIPMKVGRWGSVEFERQIRSTANASISGSTLTHGWTPVSHLILSRARQTHDVDITCNRPLSRFDRNRTAHVLHVGAPWLPVALSATPPERSTRGPTLPNLVDRWSRYASSSQCACDWPAASGMTELSVASPPATPPVICPSRMTRTRSESDRSSGKSEETTSTAASRSASARINARTRSFGQRQRRGRRSCRRLVCRDARIGGSGTLRLRCRFDAETAAAGEEGRWSGLPECERCPRRMSFVRSILACARSHTPQRPISLRAQVIELRLRPDG